MNRLFEDRLYRSDRAGESVGWTRVRHLRGRGRSDARVRSFRGRSEGPGRPVRVRGRHFAWRAQARARGGARLPPTHRALVRSVHPVVLAAGHRRCGRDPRRVDEKNGVLTVFLAKRAEAKPSRRPIQVKVTWRPEPPGGRGTRGGSQGPASPASRLLRSSLGIRPGGSGLQGRDRRRRGGGRWLREGGRGLLDALHLALALEDDALLDHEGGRLDVALHPRGMV